MEEREVEALIEQADVQMRLASWRGAIDLLRRALAIDPDHARAHAMLALALLGAKRLAGAEIECRLALALDGNEPFCHHAAAAVLRAQRKLDEAWEHCEIALAADSTDADVHVLAAGIRELRGQPDEARALLVAALEREPAHAGALTRLARLELDAHRLVRGDDAGAEAHTRFALHQDATDRDALELWAAIKARRGPRPGSSRPPGPVPAPGPAGPGPPRCPRSGAGPARARLVGPGPPPGSGLPATQPGSGPVRTGPPGAGTGPGCPLPASPATGRASRLQGQVKNS
jgi:tetratricopeptide (TPR) repeat protein